MIIGSELQKIINEYNMCALECFDNTCLNLSLGNTIIKLAPTSTISSLVYGYPIPNECIKQYIIPDGLLIIPPRASFLASSAEEIQMPMGYFGLLQTKGSLARMLVSIHYSDGQIDPGFKGHVTFELFNGSDFEIKIPCGSKVGNVYIFKCTGVGSEYTGKYKNSIIPTIQKP